MGDTIKMPGGGYDIRVVRKSDILACIDENIADVDKDLMRAFIEQMEVDAVNFISQNRWTSLPYIGTLRRNEFKDKIRSEETQELIGAAKDTLDKDKYILFRKDLRADIAASIKYERVFKYVLSHFVKQNRKFYNYLVNTKGEHYAKVLCYSLSSMELL